jgi:hypothetical protein
MTLAVLGTLSLLAGQQSNPRERSAQRIPVVGTYVSGKYGYSVRLPDRIRGFRPAPPAPQHGFGVTLQGGPEDYVWVNAEYDVLYRDAAAPAAEDTSETLSRQYGITVKKSVPSALSGLSAREVTLEGGTESGKVGHIRLVIAYRAVPREVGIIYTIGLRTKSESGEAEALFSALVASFKTAQLSD